MIHRDFERVYQIDHDTELQVETEKHPSIEIPDKDLVVVDPIHEKPSPIPVVLDKPILEKESAKHEKVPSKALERKPKKTHLRPYKATMASLQKKL